MKKEPVEVVEVPKEEGPTVESELQALEHQLSQALFGDALHCFNRHVAAIRKILAG